MSNELDISDLESFEFKLYSDMPWGGYRIFAQRRIGNQTQILQFNPEIIDVERNTFIGKNCLLITEEHAQMLANSLWDSGIRATQSNQSHGMFEAQGRHLQDMRKIVFDKLKIRENND